MLALARVVLAAAVGVTPTVSMQDATGAPLSLDAYRGRVVVLDVWAPWCVPCRGSFPFLNRLQERLGATGLSVIGLTLDADEEAIREFLAAVPASFPIARDPSGRAGDLLSVVAMPTTLLLDRQGRLAARFEGGDPSVHARIEQAVVALLSGQELPPGTDVLVGSGVRATGEVKAWERGLLAEPIMQLGGHPLTRLMREHIYASKEGAAGDGGAAGGGCGCN
jgi:thiol-disulfide isomerase/thioredoxin